MAMHFFVGVGNRTYGFGNGLENMGLAFPLMFIVPILGGMSAGLLHRMDERVLSICIGMAAAAYPLNQACFYDIHGKGERSLEAYVIPMCSMAIIAVCWGAHVVRKRLLESTQKETSN